MDMIARNFTDIKTLIADRAKLIAVSKTQPPEKIDAALATGHRLFGENRVQEAQVHWAEHRQAYPDLELHLIGPLQTNKAKDAVALFDVIQTIDRKSIVEAVSKEIKKQNRNISVFIQVNTGQEKQKSGVSVENLDDLIEYSLENSLNLTGLMCIPPVNEDPAPHFQMLSELAKKHNLKELSMGMSGDFETAIEHGATYVRIGTSLFGKR